MRFCGGAPARDSARNSKIREDAPTSPAYGANRGGAMSDEETKKLVEAIRAGDKVALDTLLSSEPRLLDFRAPNGSSALLLAAYYGHAELAEVFMRHGAKPDVFEASALGDLEAVRNLVGGDRGLVNAFAADGF